MRDKTKDFAIVIDGMAFQCHATEREAVEVGKRLGDRWRVLAGRKGREEGGEE